ncbi:MAG: fatty acid desaturase [Acidobacteriaceae bacterium]
MNRLLRSPRDELREAFPLLDGVWARLTGLSSNDQTIPKRTKIGRTVECFATFIFGVSGGIAALPLLGPAGLIIVPLLWCVTVAGARDLQLTIFHHSAHGNVFPRSPSDNTDGRSDWLRVSDRNRALGSVISTILLITPFDEYVAAHVRDHHGVQTLSTCEDETMKALKQVIGLQAGVPVAKTLRRFKFALCSPKVHWKMLTGRLRAQFGRGTPTQRIAAVAYVGAVGGFALITGWWIPVIIGWALPLSVGYQAAQIARFVVEHGWPDASEEEGKRSKAQHDSLTVAVRCAVPPPDKWSIGAIVRWTTGMAFNAAIRCMVLPGDSGPSHGWHHSQTRGDWANHISAASNWEAARRARGEPATQEAWGYCEAVRLSLESFAKAKPGECP